MSKVNPNKHAGSSMMEERVAAGRGTRAAKQSDIALLRRLVLANLLWEDNAYVDGNTVEMQIKELIPNCDPEQVAQLAIECRVEQKLRHTPLFICACMLKHPEYAPLVKVILPKIITRADMLSDMLAIYFKINTPPKGKKHAPLPNSLKIGLAKSFENFNEYAFAKYDRNAAIKLRDVMFLVHPKPSQDRVELYKKLANRTLEVPDTWEVALSTGKDKNETWTRLIKDGKLGGLAMLRNIRNMREASVDKSVIAQGLAGLKSQMLLPLNFLNAARYNPEFEREIESAMLESYKNLPKLPGRTLFIVDVSGSMGSLTSGASALSRLDQACAMAMLAMNQCQDYELVATAGADHNWTHTTEHIKYPVKGFGLAKQIYETKKRVGGGGIFTRQCLEWCKTNIKGNFDRIIIFSDSQDMDRTSVKPSPYGTNNYICDISAHKHGINYKGVWTAEISGWSEHFLTYIAAYEGIKNDFQDAE